MSKIEVRTKFCPQHGNERMIQFQVRDKGADAWRRVTDFAEVNASQVDIVEHSKLAARLVDMATGQVLVQSLPARGIPLDKEPTGITREFVLAFRKPDEVHQSTPDPNRKVAMRVVRKRAVHQAFAADGY